MLQRGFPVAVLVVPVGRARVELLDELGLGLHQVVLEKLAKEVVVAVPLAAIVEWDEKQVRALDLLKLAAGALVLEDRVAERPAQALEHRRSAQEAQRPRPQERQVLGAEVVGEVAVVAADANRVEAGLPPVADRERRQVERGSPALGLL